MSHHLTWAMLGLILCCILVETARELCFKHGANEKDVWHSLRRPIVWLGLGLWVVELVAWTNVLARVPLSIAYPLTALNYVIVLLGGAWLLGERLTKRHIIGAICIAAGVALIGATEV